MRWASWQWDVSIAPLDINRFNSSKSNIKMLEAAALSIPCLVSPAPPYADFCKKSKLLRQHLLCYSLRDWETKIEAVVRNKDLRLALGAEMRKVAGEFDALEVSKQWRKLFSELAA